VNLGELWWAEIETFEQLADATLSRLCDAGVASVVIAVVDAAGDAHFVSTDPEIGTEPMSALRATLRGEAGGAAPTALRDPDGRHWLVLDLHLGPRQVGAVAVGAPEPTVSSDWWEPLRAELAVALDLVAARYGRRRLRVGLAALRRIGSRFSGALTTTEIAQCATNEGVAALGASGCLVYQLADDALELVAERDAGHVTRPWVRIAIETSAPVSDCVRLNETVAVASRHEITDRYPFMVDHSDVPDQACLALPLVVESRPTGALFLTFHERHTFTPDELALAATIADQCAQALERTRLQRELDELREGESERRFRSALDAMTDLVTIETAIRDPDGRIVDFLIDYMNQVDIDVAGRAPNDLTGRRLLDAYPAMRDSELFHGYVQVVDTGVPMFVEELPYADTIDGNEVRGYYSVHIVKFADGIIITARDTSDARQARLDLEAAYEQVAAARQIAGLGIWSIDLASGDVTFSDELYEIFDFDPVQPVPSLYDAIFQFIDPADVELVQRLVTTTPVTREPFMVELSGRRVDGTTRLIMVAGTVTADENDVPTRLWGTAQDITEQRLAERTLQQTTEQLAREHASLLLLQDAISPRLPDFEPVELHGVYVPAGEQAHVGGDWFDAVVLDDGTLALVVGDVAGHGIAAAALMTEFRHALRAYLTHGMSAPQALAALNRVARRRSDQPYATCIAATFDPATRVLEGASAGHLPYVVARDDDARLLDVNVGSPIGAIADSHYRPFRTTLQPADTLLFFTDGLVERRDEPIDDGLDRLLAAVRLANREPDALAETCEQICDLLRPEGPTTDDLCLLALRLRGR